MNIWVQQKWSDGLIRWKKVDLLSVIHQQLYTIAIARETVAAVFRLCVIYLGNKYPAKTDVLLLLLLQNW